MKRKQFTTTPRVVKAACRVSAAALMLGVSHATSVGLHFQVNYCGAPAYSGYPVTMTAFGLPPSSWENLAQMTTGYNAGTCPTPGPYFSMSQTVDTTTDTDGLNPLPSGSLSITWSANGANFTPFYGYAGSPPTYTGGGPLQNPKTGEQQVYASFLRDGKNYGVPGDADNNLPPYLIDITGMKSLFPNNPYVVQVIASSDSMFTQTNALIIDVALGTTQAVSYPSTPTPSDAHSTPWLRGNGGGLSTGSGAVNADHLQITADHPAHGVPDGYPGYNMAGNISGFIVTDKPLITMAAQPVKAGPGDTVTLNPYAIGVPPLAYQWRRNGQAIPGATSSSITVPNLNRDNAGNYDLVVTNLYGSVTSAVSSLSGNPIVLASGNNLILDSSTVGTEHDGLNSGTVWSASLTDGVKTRTGVTTFPGLTTGSGIVVPSSSDLKPDTGTIMFWVKSPGTLPGSANGGAAILDCASGANARGGVVIYVGEPGDILFQATDGGGTSQNQTGAGQIMDNLWHHVAFTFDDSESGTVSFYFDGAEIIPDNGNNHAWSWPSAQELEIGFSHDTNWNAFTGSLDDIRVYNRILTPAEVVSASNGPLVDASALELQFNFDTAPIGGFSLEWPAGTDVLQSAPTANGTYTDLPGAGTPYVVPARGTQKFFRYKHTPVTTITNPYLM